MCINAAPALYVAALISWKLKDGRNFYMLFPSLAFAFQLLEKLLVAASVCITNYKKSRLPQSHTGLAQAYCSYVPFLSTPEASL